LTPPARPGEAFIEGLSPDRLARGMLERLAERESLRHRRTTSGTGLVEVLVAAALTLVLAVGAAEMMTLALRAKRRGDLAAAISHAMADRVEELKSRPFDDPALAAGDYAATLRVEPAGRLIAETWHITDDGERLKRIRLAAREAGREAPETVTVMVISRDLGFRP
jgi:hypothetical protein